MEQTAESLIFNIYTDLPLPSLMSLVNIVTIAVIRYGMQGYRHFSITAITLSIKTKRNLIMCGGHSDQNLATGFL